MKLIDADKLAEGDEVLVAPSGDLPRCGLAFVCGPVTEAFELPVRFDGSHRTVWVPLRLISAATSSTR